MRRATSPKEACVSHSPCAMLSGHVATPLTETTVTLRFGLILALSNIAALGASITYNYQGANFNRCGHGGCPPNYTDDYVVGSLMFSNPLVPNLSSADVSASLLSWSVGDHLGWSTYSSATTGHFTVFGLSTNANGTITGYGIEVHGNPGEDAALYNPPQVGQGSGQLFADGIDADIPGFGFAASTGLTGQWTETINGLPGGTSSAPTFLFGGNPITSVSGTIGGASSQAYYAFQWGGGPLSINASVTGAPTTDSFLFTGGGLNSCSNIGSQTLDSSNGFAGTLSLGNVASGQYCVGLNASALNDPDFALTFSSGVTGVPEPAGVWLVLAGLAVIVARWKLG